MGKGKKKGGKGGAGAAGGGGGGDTSGGQPPKPESQPSSSHAGGDASQRGKQKPPPDQQKEPPQKQPGPPPSGPSKQLAQGAWGTGGQGQEQKEHAVSPQTAQSPWQRGGTPPQTGGPPPGIQSSQQGQQRGPPTGQQQWGPRQQNVQGHQPAQQRVLSEQSRGPSHQQYAQGQQQSPQRGPPPQQYTQGQQPQQRGPPQQQFAQGQQQPQQRGPPPQQRGPPPQQYAQGQQQPQQRGPPPQQRGPPPQQYAQGQQQPQQRGPPPQQFAQGQQQSQHRGPPPQQYAQGHQQQQSGPPPQQYVVQGQQQRGPPAQKGGPKVASQGASPRKRAGDQSVQKFTPIPILSLEEQMQQMSIMQPKKIVPGTSGRKITIETNYLHLDLGKLKTANHYDVQIDPDTPKKFMRDVFEEFRRKHFPKSHPAFDGRKNMYSPFDLVPRGETLNDNITIRDGEREKVFKVQVQFANSVDLTPLHQIRMTLMSPQEAIQCVEIVLRSAPSSRCIQAGRSFFTRPQSIIDLGEGMEMYNGFYQSVVRGWKPLLNVDVAHKAFPKDIDIVSLIMEVCSTFRQRVTAEDLRTRGMAERQITDVAKFLRTLRVVYEIPCQPGSKREYRVNGLKGCPRNVKFRPDNGPEITIEEYFAKKKNYRLKYPLLPTLWVGNMQRPDPILLPAELCTLVAGQTVNRKMTENQTSAMIKSAATSTTVRKEKIMRSLDQTRHNEDPCIREFGFNIRSEFEKIQARVLMPPVLEYDMRKTITPRSGVWRQDNTKFLRGAQINSWTIISACGTLDNVAKLANDIYNFGPKCGMTLAARATEPFEQLRGYQPRYSDVEDCLKRCFAKRHDLVFVVIPDSGPTYSDVKKAAELNIGCLTQCIKRRTLFKLTPPTVNNILLKVNSKLNGTNHCLSVRPQILSEPCMIMGADVTHPSPDSQHIPSVAAVTASHDPKAFCYNICCRLQSPKVEIISDLEAITREHLMYFYKMNKGQKPRRIVFFRDGVSEGQFIEVLTKEVTAIRSACSKLEADYQPKITFLVVQKRHHTRFFPMDKRDSEDRNFNVPAGTCVDTQITNPMMQDFYLVSHASIQGVAKPTKYCTLWDDNDMSNDDIEQLTYHLCHLFTRCNRSVSYPAPTYYAHLAAARAKVYIENDNLDLTNLGKEQKRIDILDTIRKNKPMFFV